ncbi:Craniofacial development protein 2 [Varanus komodoensis]|nr:Craniofacial development protein 2 [Varanus komodoensis]
MRSLGGLAEPGLRRAERCSLEGADPAGGRAASGDRCHGCGSGNHLPRRRKDIPKERPDMCGPLYRVTQDGQVIAESSDKTSTGEGNGNPLQYLCHENPMDSTKRKKDMTPEEEPLRSEGVQYATGEEQRASTSSTRKNEATGSKPKGHSVADVSGGERRVRCCKDLYSIGTWNIRSMNQGKLDVVKQEMTRLNIDILGISELKCTRMGEFNSDDHQSSLAMLPPEFPGERTGAAIGVVMGNGRNSGGGLTCPHRRRRDRWLTPVPTSGFAPSQKVPGSLVSRPSGLTVLLFNARSANNKSALIHDLIVDEGADLACITETWAGEGGDVALSQLCPPGYMVQHCSRPEGRGGGVALVYRASITLTGLPVPSRPGLECLYLVLGNRDRLGILLVYRAPFCPTVSLPELTETVSDLVLRTPRMLVLGDFNIHAEASLTGAAQDFMASMTAMGLSQHITGPTHERGHTLDLVFSTGQEEGGLRVRNLCLTPLSWSDHFLVRFVLESDISLCKGADPIVWVRPRSRMDPEGFLKALGEFPADKTGAPVEALVELWNGEMTRAVDTIAPKRPLPPGRARSSPWYTPELRAMKQVGRRLERRWRKSRDESDRTHLRAHYRAYAVAVRAAKKRHFSASIASSQCRPAELFRVVQGLVHPGPKEELTPPSKARCDDFAEHFREKIAQIRHELDSTIDSEVLRETPTLPSGPELLDEFQLLRPDDVDKVLGRVRPTTCLLDPCPSWLIKDSKHGIGTWILEVVNASLREGRVPAPLKEAVVRPVLKKASLDPGMAANYRPVANIPFLGKVLERVVAGQLQALLDETDYLDPFQSGFRPGYGTESALVALYDDLCREKDRGSASLLVLLDLSAAFDTIDHGILLDRLAGLGVGGTALRWFRSYLND